MKEGHMLMNVIFIHQISMPVPIKPLEQSYLCKTRALQTVKICNAEHDLLSKVIIAMLP